MYLHASRIEMPHPSSGVRSWSGVARRRRSSPAFSTRQKEHLRMSVNVRDRDIISITDFSREEILALCDAGRRMAEHGEDRAGATRCATR